MRLDRRGLQAQEGHLPVNPPRAGRSLRANEPPATSPSGWGAGQSPARLAIREGDPARGRRRRQRKHEHRHASGAQDAVRDAAENGRARARDPVREPEHPGQDARGRVRQALRPARHPVAPVRRVGPRPGRELRPEPGARPLDGVPLRHDLRPDASRVTDIHLVLSVPLVATCVSILPPGRSAAPGARSA